MSIDDGTISTCFRTAIRLKSTDFGDIQSNLTRTIRNTRNVIIEQSVRYKMCTSGVISVQHNHNVCSERFASEFVAVVDHNASWLQPAADVCSHHLVCMM